MSNSRVKTWEEIDAAEGGRLSQRAYEIRAVHKTISEAEAPIAVLAEMGYDTWAMCTILQRALHTIELQRSSIRKKMKAPRGVALGLLFTEVPRTHENP